MSLAENPSASGAPAFSPTTTGRRAERAGILLVFLSAVVWSFGGTIAPFLRAEDSWTVVFWRSLWAAAFLLAFMAWRDGARGTAALFRGMGVPGFAVALCFAIAGTSFVLALSLTTVANVVLMQAGVPLLAALIGLLFFREKVSRATAFAIAAVIAGVGIMVSDSLDGRGSLAGNALALLIACVFALATVLTRRFSHVRMTPATCLGVILSAGFAAAQAGSLRVSGTDMGVLIVFGALNMGLGLVLFASGARLVPAALAALLGTAEPVLAPVWAWIVHGQVPAGRTLAGGALVLAALLVHLAFEIRRQSLPAAKPGSAGLPLPQ